VTDLLRFRWVTERQAIQMALSNGNWFDVGTQTPSLVAAAAPLHLQTRTPPRADADDGKAIAFHADRRRHRRCRADELEQHVVGGAEDVRVQREPVIGVRTRVAVRQQRRAQRDDGREQVGWADRRRASDRKSATGAPSS
jgi:hypothetical protein